MNASFYRLNCGWTARVLAAVVLTMAGSCLASAASAQSLEGVWASNRPGVPPRVLTRDGDGRYSVRSRGALIAYVWVVGSDVAYTATDGLGYRGTITEFYNSRPSAIRFTDGTTYRKWGTPQPAPAPAQPLPAPPVPEAPVVPANLSGVWTSNIGLTYRISQVGDSFSWTIDGLAQTGQGTITGNRLQANWQGPLSRGNSGGTVRMGSFGPERIDFDNGYILTIR